MPDLKARSKTAKKNQRFDKPDDSETAQTEPAPTEAEPEAASEPKRRRKSGARAKADKLAKEQYGIEQRRPMTAKQRKQKRADQMRARRETWVQLNTEVSPEHMADLERLKVEHGSIKAVVAHLIGSAKIPK